MFMLLFTVHCVNLFVFFNFFLMLATWCLEIKWNGMEKYNAKHTIGVIYSKNDSCYCTNAYKVGGRAPEDVHCNFGAYP